MARLATVVGFCLLVPDLLAAQDVLTWRNDAQRTGQNLHETTLTPANVGSSSFGMLFSQGVDGYVYAQPLYKSSVSISGSGTHNVVFVATEHNSVYAFDADDNAGSNSSPLWSVNLGPSVPNGDVGTTDIVPEIGITGTPVIDPATGTLYVVAKTKEAGTYVQRLHALDITSGAEKFGGPVVIQATVPGTGDGTTGSSLSFDSLHQHQRPALLLSGGVVYIAWGSHGDNRPYHGWILGYNASTLAQTAAFNSTPNDAMGGIWMAGALAADAGGTLYATSGNGVQNPDPTSSSYANSVIKLSPGLSVLDYFAPSDSATLNAEDLDLGSGGCLILPDQPGPYPHLLIQGGKSGILRVLNRDNLGQYHSGGDQVVQAVNLSGMLFSTC
ncbi:MAG TPA: pyrrolo-quinoline quinone, partial [Planctomycetota bacterium]|nr:pyrrolo-quinoline quinone [Planctomycetota bacterium]